MFCKLDRRAIGLGECYLGCCRAWRWGYLEAVFRGLVDGADDCAARAAGIADGPDHDASCLCVHSTGGLLYPSS